MKNTLKTYLNRLKKDRRQQKKMAAVLICMSLIVAGITIWSLHLTGESQTAKPYCNHEEHQHDESCLQEKVLICNDESHQSAQHTHDDSCYEMQEVLTCELEETAGHSHSENCYNENGDLICGMEESAGHTHTVENGCYTTQRVLICTMIENTGSEESDLSGHTDECYEITYSCGKEEHTHTLSCFSNLEADIETEDVWKKSMETAELTGSYAQDLVSIAKTQLGYTESTDNYKVVLDEEGNETEQIKGYTRYGEWYSSKNEDSADHRYSDWDAMFISFCLNYANIPEELFPQLAGSEEYVQILSSENYNLYYQAESGYYPSEGDLIFFDNNEDGTVDHAGIVSQLIPVSEEGTVTNEEGDPLASVSFKTIEGDCANKVDERAYEYTDSKIAGYASMNLWKNMEDSQRVAYVSGLITHLPSFEEAMETMNAYDEADDEDGAAAYYQNLQRQVEGALVLYYELSPELREQVEGAEELLCWEEMFSEDTLAVKVNVSVKRRNLPVEENQTGATIINMSGKTVMEATGSNYTFWTEIKIQKEGDYLVVKSIEPYGTAHGEDVVPDNGFLLMVSGSYTQAAVGYYATCSKNYLWQNTTSTSNLSGTITFSDSISATGSNGRQKDPKDNTDQLETIEGVDTSSFITLNLYDYSDNINDMYNNNKNYPGFQTQYNTSGTNFGNAIMSDIKAGIDGVSNTGGAINRVFAGANLPASLYSANYNKANAANTVGNPLTVSPMYSQLVNGYPALKNGNSTLSLQYLFSQNEYAQKMNTNSINNLFVYDKETGMYSYNSRENHAQFDSETDTFTLYKQRLTANFMMYPFGNFLPLNDIVKDSKKSSEIDAAYLQQIAASAQYKHKNGSDSEYSSVSGYTTPYRTLYNTLTSFITSMNTNYGNSWTAEDALKAYFKTSDDFKGSNAGNLDKVIENIRENDILENTYTLDFDEPSNFYFGMEMQMKFIQSKGGITSKGKDMILRFTGDDDVLFYIDDVLFLDLSGIHRHVGGEIDFKKGEVRYYGLSVETGDVETTPVKTVTFDAILRAANKTAAANQLVNGTFADYTSHTLNWYYMERGSGSGICRLEFNMEQVAPTGIYKVDQYGTAVPGATFAAYPAAIVTENNKQVYKYATEPNGEAISSSVNSVDSKTGVITFENGSTISPEFIGTTDITGQMIFAKSDGEAMALSEMKAAFGDQFILREVKVPDGYRTVADESWMYFSNELLLCANTLSSGTWASSNATIKAPETIYPVTEGTDAIQYYDYDNQGNVTGPGELAEPNGTLFAVILKRKGDSDSNDFNTWYPVTGNDTEGYTVSDSNGIASAIEAAKTYSNSEGINNHVFSIGQIKSVENGESKMDIGMVATIEELPGNPESYYTWLINNDSDKLSQAMYLVAYYHTDGTLEQATAANTVQITSHSQRQDIFHTEIEDFTVQWSSTIEIPNNINTLYFQKTDESVSMLIDNAVFALYDVATDDNDKGYFTAIGQNNEKVYIRLDEDANQDSVSGKATVYNVLNGRNGITGSYTIASDSIQIPENSPTGYIDAADAGVITVKINVGENEITYTITPSKNAEGTNMVGFTHDRCASISEEGTGHFKLLKTGNYFLKEIAAPTGYILNRENVMVSVTEDGVYANAGTVDNGVRVGNGPGYLVKTLDVFASIGHIDETYAWIYSLLKVDSGHTDSFLQNVEFGNNFGISDTSYPLFECRIKTGDTESEITTTSNITSGQNSNEENGQNTSALTDNNNPYEGTEAMVIYLAYDGNANAGGTTDESIFDYAVVTNLTRKTKLSDRSGVLGKETKRLWTESGWSDLAIYQDTTYGNIRPNQFTNYENYGGIDIANLFSSSTFVQVSDTVNIDLTVTKVTDDFYASTEDKDAKKATVVYLDDAQFNLTRYVTNTGKIVERSTAVDEDEIKEGYSLEYYNSSSKAWELTPSNLTTETWFTQENQTPQKVTTKVYVDNDGIYTKVYTVNGNTYVLPEPIKDGIATLKPVTVTSNTDGSTTINDSTGDPLTGTLARSYFKIYGLSQGTYYLNEAVKPSYTDKETGGSGVFRNIDETEIVISDGKYYYYEKGNNKIIVEEKNALDDDGKPLEEYVLDDGSKERLFQGNSFSIKVTGDYASYLVQLDDKGTTAPYFENDENSINTIQMGFRVTNTTKNANADVQLVKLNESAVSPALTTVGYNPQKSSFTVKTGTETETHNILSGAKFKLYRIVEEEGDANQEESSQTKYYYKINKDGTVMVTSDEGEASELSVDQNGYLKITGLIKDYEYYLVEVKAPDGFNLLTDKVSISWEGDELKVVGATTQVVEKSDPDPDETYIVIYNSNGYELPHTGGTGTLMFTLGGIGLIAISLTCEISIKRKRN